MAPSAGEEVISRMVHNEVTDTISVVIAAVGEAKEELYQKGETTKWLQTTSTDVPRAGASIRVGKQHGGRSPHPSIRFSTPATEDADKLHVAAQ